MIFHQYLLSLFGIDFNTALADNLIFNGLLMIDCYLVSNMFHYYRPQKEKFLYILFLSFFLSAFWVLFSKWIMLHFVTVDEVYIAFLQKSLALRFINGALLVSVIGFTSQLCYRFEDQSEQLSRNADAEKLAREAELFKLRQQLQPHFLFNSLNSISALIGSRPEEARKMIHQLSDFLRGTIKREDVELITLAEELEYLTLYLEIEKVRFGHRLDTEVSVSSDVMKATLPPMLLQPIVENAIKFGLYDTTESVKIIIKGEMIKNELHIEVVNPFDPETATPRQGTGFGLSAIERRLYLLYFRQDLLHTSSDAKLFTTRIQIPQKHD
jgi:sensor histidine kinase YesM